MPAAHCADCSFGKDTIARQYLDARHGTFCAEKRLQGHLPFNICLRIDGIDDPGWRSGNLNA